MFQLTPRVKADAFAVTARSVLTYITVVHLDMGVVGFGVAQLSYGLTHCITLISHHKSVFGDISKIADFFPTLSKSSTAYKSRGGLTSVFALVDRAVGLDQTKEALLMSGTSVLKHFLTEAVGPCLLFHHYCLLRKSNCLLSIISFNERFVGQNSAFCHR